MPGPPPGPAFVPATAHTYVDLLDDSIRLDGADGHHLQRVRRIEVGETVTAADGFGRWRAYRVTTAADGALELGVDRIVFVRAARSVVRWDDARAASSMHRLERVAREAGAQSRRARLPVLDGPVAPGELAAHPGLVVADLRGAAADELPEPGPGDDDRPEWLVAIGPEGGFTPSELDDFGAAPRLAVGHHVLRAESAAIAAAAAIAGRRRPPGR